MKREIMEKVNGVFGVKGIFGVKGVLRPKRTFFSIFIVSSSPVKIEWR